MNPNSGAMLALPSLGGLTGEESSNVISSPPLLWQRAGAWAEQLSKRTGNADYQTGWEERRYGPSTVRFIKAILPKLARLCCPAGQPDTFVVPCIFDDLLSFEDYYFEPNSGRYEVASSKYLFAVGLGVLAKEMVLAHARSSHTCSCRVLVMWALLTPLDHFEAYAEKNLLATCRTFHAEWGLDEPLATYAVAYEYFVL